MSATSLTTRLAHATEIDTVLPACLDAFSDEAVATWVAPERASRRTMLQDLFEQSVRSAIDAEQLVIAVASDGDTVAASIWIHRDGSPDASEPVPSRSGLLTWRLASVESATAQRRPGSPHVHLSAMATRPQHRGRGAGTAMLTHGIDRAREAGLPVYLEASTPRNRALYARHGFRPHGAPIRLPDGGPALQPMWLTD